jgi:hypothetical protein
MTVETELMLEVWNSSGWHHEIGPDRDGLGMVEIRYYEERQTNTTHRLAFSVEEAEHIAAAILKVAADMKQRGTI